MGMPQRRTEIVYHLDREGRILDVNEAWDDFARTNDGEAILGAHVVGRPLWDFIGDPVTRLLYEQLLDRLREARRDLRFRLRCDSPGRRRLLDVTISEVPGGGIEFRNRLVESSDRDVPILLDPAAPRSSETIRMCSWCRRAQVGDRWLEVEDVVRELRMFERETVPQLSHGTCPDCYRQMSDYDALH